jgi:hypothetical protein
MNKAMGKPRPKGRGGRKSTGSAAGGREPDQVFREFAWNLAGTLAKPAGRIGAGEGKP